MKQANEKLKIIARKHKPVKQYLRTFIEKYEEVFEPIRDKKLAILEIGVGGYKDSNRGGGSLRMWGEYFKNSHIVGIDINDKNLDLPSNVTFQQGSQTDLAFLDRIITEYGPFDIVIDDASHVTKNTVKTFEALWEQTKFCYIVEDLHMKKASGTTEYFEGFGGFDFSTKNMCVAVKQKSLYNTQNHQQGETDE